MDASAETWREITLRTEKEHDVILKRIKSIAKKSYKFIQKDEPTYDDLWHCRELLNEIIWYTS